MLWDVGFDHRNTLCDSNESGTFTQQQLSTNNKRPFQIKIYCCKVWFPLILPAGKREGVGNCYWQERAGAKTANKSHMTLF